MDRSFRPAVLFTLLILGLAQFAPTMALSQEAAADRREDVVYGRKDGLALTMDVFTPKQNANGAAIVWVISGGWFSTHDAINQPSIAEFLRRGYTVFAVVHGSQPRYTIPDAIADMNLAVRYIRQHAEEFHIDPDRIGVTGASAGGHLSLMLGTAGTPGDPAAKTPVERYSSRVQAVACFFPPTDFLNYGKPGENAIGRGILKDFKAPFTFKEADPVTHVLHPITDEARIEEIGRQVSPINHVSSDDAPTLIIHGDADALVPIQQAELVIDKLKKEGVDAQLVVKKGGLHGWPDIFKDASTLADWFDSHLLKKDASAAKAAN